MGTCELTLTDLLADPMTLAVMAADRADPAALAAALSGLARRLEFARPAAGAKNITLVIEEGLPLRTLADRPQLLRVVENLVTNAIKYANGDVMLRLILEPDTLVCEVHDSSPALPRVLQVDKDAENGRGLHVVSQMASHWGMRRTSGGKVVWCEQQVPAEVTEAMLAAMSTVAPIAEAEPAAV